MAFSFSIPKGEDIYVEARAAGEGAAYIIREISHPSFKTLSQHVKVFPFFYNETFIHMT